MKRSCLVDVSLAGLALWLVHPASRFAVRAATASTSASRTGVNSAGYPDCTGNPLYIGDGECDERNNSAECGYDGGDCCICTCVDVEFACGEEGYSCLDPSVSDECLLASENYTPLDSWDTIDGDFSYCYDAGGAASSIADGYCNAENNNQECDYDGGDCCTCTCQDSDKFSCGSGDYDCIDPSVSAECVEESERHFSLTTSNDPYPDCTAAGGLGGYVGDGDCDIFNSIAECEYDGGDCCICTCEDSGQFNCGGYGGYVCNDPSVSEECREESNAFIPSPTSDLPESEEYPDCNAAGGLGLVAGDGDCDHFNSIPECGYDGGDCCICTCEDTEVFTCGEFGGYYCRDPSVSDTCRDESNYYVPPPSY